MTPLLPSKYQATEPRKTHPIGYYALTQLRTLDLLVLLLMLIEGNSRCIPLPFLSQQPNNMHHQRRNQGSTSRSLDSPILSSACASEILTCWTVGTYLHCTFLRSLPKPKHMPYNQRRNPEACSWPANEGLSPRTASSDSFSHHNVFLRCLEMTPKETLRRPCFCLLLPGLCWYWLGRIDGSAEVHRVGKFGNNINDAMQSGLRHKDIQISRIFILSILTHSREVHHLPDYITASGI
jgi:hypothetical protein